VNGAHNMKRRYPCQRLNPFINSSAEKAAKSPISQEKIPCLQGNFQTDALFYNLPARPHFA
jgi:hypothetical protein